MDWKTFCENFPARPVAERPEGDAFPTQPSAESAKDKLEELHEFCMEVVSFGGEFFVLPKD